MFVGVGQYLAADPVSNCVVIAGMDASVKGYRIFEVCPFSGAPGKGIPIATVPAPAVGLLGSSSAIDYNLGGWAPRARAARCHPTTHSRAAPFLIGLSSRQKRQANGRLAGCL